MTKVPFVDLRRHHDPLRDQFAEVFSQTLLSGDFVLGNNMKCFEERFAAYLGCRHAVGISNGTDALELALATAGLGPGDEVLTVANSFIATVEAIVRCGATPRFVDIDPSTGLMDAAGVESAVTPQTKVIMPVHLYGAMCDMPAICDIARRHGLKVIEDACQAHGATLHGRAAGTWGDFGCFSFYPSKNLGALGDGGAVVTNSDEGARWLCAARNHGSSERYVHALDGRNARLDSFQAAVLTVKLPLLDNWNEGRRCAARRYRERLQGTPGLVLLDTPADESNVCHLFVVRSPRREALKRVLEQRGMGVAIHYPYAIHRQPVFSSRPWSNVTLPHTERHAAEVLSLPMFHGISSVEVEAVCETVLAFFQEENESQNVSYKAKV